jgi:diguanylate cyclase (GGDEF)-like protein
VERSSPAIARLGAALVAPLAVGVLRLFPPVPISASSAATWLPSALYAAAALTLALAGGLAVAHGLRHRSAARLLDGTGLGVAAAALAAAALRGLDAGGLMPDAGLPLALLVAGMLLLASRAIPAGIGDGVPRLAAGVLVFLGIEAALAAALLVSVPTTAWPWLFAAAAVLAGAAAFPGASTGPAVLAGGLLALGLARPGSVENAAAMLALAAAGLGYGWPRAVATATVGADAEPPADVPRVTDDEPMPGRPWPRSVPERAWPATGPVLPDDEAVRLARELHGTIEELLQARRTIELQRAEIARDDATDQLTGVASRRAILGRLRLEAAEARRYTHPVALLLIDVDGFTQLNAEHSLAVGDAVLRELALRLRLRMREADALGRIGGDAFAAILPHTDERGAAVFADAVRRRLTARPVSTDAGEVTISVSIGVAFVRPGMALSDEELLAAAEEALASARAAGGNRIAFDRLHGLVRLDERRADADADPPVRGIGPA